ncbi:fimbrial protein [Scandinavium manionii]|uniref:fimbrial protein n=1 Tax=Scandinavium manionii TaxID=2926520 RepID=UPI002165970E|nr:fimbrial protein [Scandinavium manionii]MCS2150254.1 fimbrial protein [Scandinavium manionii]MCS2166464.1 fimbrial protein [Scandinavium manionii]
MNIKHSWIMSGVLLIGSYTPVSFAQNVNVDFTANIRETTCDMRITGGTGDGQNNTIQIGAGGKTSLDKILSGDSSVSVPFSLDIVSCPSSLSALKTTISGTRSSYISSAIANGASGADKADFIGVQISRASGGNAFIINSTNDAERLVWTNDEISTQKKVDLLAKLVTTSASDATTGEFNAVATFNFTYQ